MPKIGATVPAPHWVALGSVGVGVGVGGGAVAGVADGRAPSEEHAATSSDVKASSKALVCIPTTSAPYYRGERRPPFDRFKTN
jgi:hypothetical protein